MTRRDYPGQRKTLEEYYDKEPIISGEYKGVEYRIYRTRGHYCAYVKLENVERHHIEQKEMPFPPTGNYFNYGPDEEGWVGCSTASPVDYNYTSDWKKLSGDSREAPSDENSFVSEEDIIDWTPILLEEEMVEWIKKVQEETDYS